MGGKSSSSSTTNNFTDASTANISQAGSAAGVVGSRNRVSVNILDGGAINDAFGFGGDSLEVLDKTVSSSLNFSESVVDTSLDNVNNVVDSGFSFGRNSLGFADESLEQSFEFGTGSLDAAFAFSKDIADRSSLENRAILNSAINASNGAQSSVLKFAKDVATPQSQIVKTSIIALVVIAGIGFVVSRKK